MVSLLQFTVARRIDDLLKNMQHSLKQKVSKYFAFSIALGKSTDISDTTQLVFLVISLIL